MGMVAVTEPALAVIVAVRLVLLLPHVSVTVAGVVTDPVLRIPLVVVSVTVWPDKTAFPESKALIVMLEAAELMVLMVVGSADKSMAETVVVVPSSPPPPSSPPWLPPHALRAATSAKTKSQFIIEKNFFLKE